METLQERRQVVTVREYNLLINLRSMQAGLSDTPPGGQYERQKRLRISSVPDLEDVASVTRNEDP